MDYSSEVRRRFSAPAHAGRIEPARGDSVEIVECAAEDHSLGTWVRFQVEAEGATIRQVRFGAFGCPHTVAAADLIAESLEGRPVAALAELDLGTVATQLGLPREKHGKLLRMEDALAGCHRQLAGSERK